MKIDLAHIDEYHISEMNTEMNNGNTRQTISRNTDTLIWTPTEHLLDLFTSESEHPKLIIIIVLSNINKRILSPESTSRTGA